MGDLFLYHATGRENLESIKKNGLLINPPSHAYEETMGLEWLKGKIFLALSADAAEAYAETSEAFDDIVVLKVDLDCLNEDNIQYDWNNRCEYYKDINSCVYLSDIPGELLQECDPSKEPSQNIHSFKGTDMYETIMCTFEEECETNLEETEDGDW